MEGVREMGGLRGASPLPCYRKGAAFRIPKAARPCWRAQGRAHAEGLPGTPDPPRTVALALVPALPNRA